MNRLRAGILSILFTKVSSAHDRCSINIFFSEGISSLTDKGKVDSGGLGGSPGSQSWSIGTEGSQLPMQGPFPLPWAWKV